MIAVPFAPAVTESDSPQIQAELDRIEQRLLAGYDKIDRAVALGQDVRRWEELWLNLLLEYEELYDRMAA